MGHTGYVAWSMTDNNPDVASFYRIRTNPANANQYDYMGRWQNFQTTVLPIRALNGSKMLDTPIPIQTTAWGPVVPGQGIALHLTHPELANVIKQTLAMLKAQNVAQFRDALRLRGIAMWNFVYADTGGHIAYQYNACLAKRDRRFNWDAPVPGDDPKTAWGAYFTLDELPHAEDPASGILVNCNTAPWLTTLGSEIPTGWPAYVTSYQRTTRYDRLAPLLAQSPPLTPALAMRIATDTQVPFAQAAVAALKLDFAKSATRPTGDLAAAVATISTWDCRADIDSRGCALYWYWLQADPQCHGLAELSAQGKPWNADQNEIAGDALAKATQTMMKLYGRVDIPWGRMHVQDRGKSATPVSGFSVQWDETSAVVPNDGYVDKGAIHCTFGSSFRMIVDLDPAGIQSWSILPYGDSQNPSSPHYNDQAALFGRGEYIDDFFGLPGATAHAMSTVTMAF
jgi:acyl-homoserine lactone acylase PvdQ